MWKFPSIARSAQGPDKAEEVASGNTRIVPAECLPRRSPRPPLHCVRSRSNTAPSRACKSRDSGCGAQSGPSACDPETRHVGHTRSSLQTVGRPLEPISSADPLRSVLPFCLSQSKILPVCNLRSAIQRWGFPWPSDLPGSPASEGH
jgi:hypothetical protein